MEIRGDRSRKFGGKVGVKGSLVGCHLKVQHFYTVDLTFLNGRSKLQRKGFFLFVTQNSAFLYSRSIVRRINILKYITKN